MTELLSFVLHVDQHLVTLIDFFGVWTYVALFGVIFAETGLVVTPFLPGDSLLFAIGALSGGGFLNVWVIYFSLLVAVFLGDNVNYWLGYFIGEKVFSRENSKIFNKAYLEKTRQFYAKHGGKTIILARFLPIVRTFAPFVAGIGRMSYRIFIFYSVIGSLAWVTSMVWAGYFFGSLPFVKENFETVVIGIIILSVSPMIFEYIKHKKGPKISSRDLAGDTYQEINRTFDRKGLDND